MTIDSAINKIDRYLKKDNGSTLIVDVQNKADLSALVTHYYLPQNIFVKASDSEFCNQDEFPRIEDLINKFQKENKNFFVQEISSFYYLQGETALEKTLAELLSMNIAGHLVVLTYQCMNQLKKVINNHKNLENGVCLIEGEAHSKPNLIFIAEGITLNDNQIREFKGIDRIAGAVESEISDTIYIETKKSKETFPLSLYSIVDLKNPYDVLCQRDSATIKLDQNIGTEEDWQYILTEFLNYPKWELLIEAKIGNTKNLDMALSNYAYNKANKKWLWLYLIGLKLFGAGSNQYLDDAAKRASSTDEFIRNIYRDILEIDPSSSGFKDVYEQRKVILNTIENPSAEVIDFCKIVISKGKDALYYLTDNTVQEKELIFSLLDEYGLSFERSELLSIIRQIYPDLWYYLTPYHFKNELLDKYFQEYKYQKVINKILSEFNELVEEQAVERDYNTILQPRSSITEEIDQTNAQTYFIDAMGVEYLGYILSKCQEYSMMAKISICRCELPSITCFNKEFYDLFSSEKYPIRSVKELDDLKHHGKYNYDYEKRSKLPIHLVKELEIIDGLLKKINADLINGAYSKAILISDHGASRLAVISGQENLLEMASNGEHSGRCCPKSEVDEQPENAVDAGDFWVLANYDRFKGSRKANVEVHGGATLEEVTVPVIEITCISENIEVKLLPVDSPATFSGVPEIMVSYRKPAAIKIYISQKLEDVTIEIDGHNYDAKRVEDYYYIVETMPEIRRAKLYNVDVFSCGNRIAEGLQLCVKKESGSEKSIL